MKLRLRKAVHWLTTRKRLAAVVLVDREADGKADGEVCRGGDGDDTSDPAA